jgi:two-component system OmpR family sensor kinase
VLANLLANSRTHTPPGSTVTVKLKSGRDGLVTMTVTDDGPGIPAQLQPTIFERFVRSDTVRAHTEGNTGLGLAIVHGIVTAHHGRVTLSSQPGRTTFTVQLPAGPSARAGAGWQLDQELHNAVILEGDQLPGTGLGRP